MGTTQSVVAKLESGRSMPSTRTLHRYAKATGSKLRITLIADGKRA
jgi:transcriptional regulator with XRE-family HTH domain